MPSHSNWFHDLCIGYEVFIILFLCPIGDVLKWCTTLTFIRSLYLLLIFLLVILVTWRVYKYQLQRVVSQVKSSIYELDDLHSPGDSRLISVSPILFDAVQFNSVGLDISSSISIYVVDSNISDSCKSSAHTEAIINESEHTVYPNAYELWGRYLYPGSRIYGSICIHNSTLPAYIIKGKNNLRLMMDTARIDELIYHVENNTDVPMCPDIGTVNYDVREEEYYYVMVANFGSSTEREFNINLTFERCQYHSTSQNPQTYCNITPYQWCEILLSFGYNNKEFLITTSAPSDSSCRRELQKVVIQYRYRRELLFVYFIILFSLITLLYAYPQFRSCTVPAVLIVIGLPMYTETDILSYLI